MSGSQTKKQKFGIVFVVLMLIGAAGLFVLLEKYKQNRIQADLTAAALPVSQTLQDKGLQNKATENSIVSIEDEDNEEYAKPVVCGPTDKTETVRLSNRRFLTLLSQKEVWMVIVGSDACYQKGQSAVATVFKAENGVTYELTPRGRVTIEDIQEFTMDQLKSEKKLLLTDVEERTVRRGMRIRANLTGENEKEIKVKAVHLKSENWYETKMTYGAPMQHPLARTLTYAQLNAARSAGETVYDVRPERSFSIKSIPGAANAPVLSFDSHQYVLQSPRQLKELGFEVDLSQLPTGKKVPLILFSSCGGDFLSYNAITYLRGQGFKNIRWYRGGLENFLSNGKGGCGTPKTVPKVQTLNADEVRKKLTEKAVPLFILEGANPRKYEIKGSEKLIYRQKYFADFMPAFRKADFTLQEFQKSGDELNLDTLKIPKETSIVVYGRYDYDWRSLKAVQVLKLNGYKSVFWYRMGLDDWLNHALFRPQDFPTTPEFVRE